MFGFYLRDNTRVLPSCYPRDTIMNREARARKTESPTNLDQVAMAIMMRAATQHSRTNSPTWSVTLGAAIPTEPTHRATTTYPWAKSRRRPGPLQVDIVSFSTLQDVIANTIGGLIGVLVAFAIRGMVHARDRKVVARALWDAQFGGGYRR